MFFIVIVMLAATALLYIAGPLQNHGHAWADQVCTTAQGLCGYPNAVAIAAAIAFITYAIMQMQKP
jgi:hypothetical protein